MMPIILRIVTTRSGFAPLQAEDFWHECYPNDSLTILADDIEFAATTTHVQFLAQFSHHSRTWLDFELCTTVLLVHDLFAAGHSIFETGVDFNAIETCWDYLLDEIYCPNSYVLSDGRFNGNFSQYRLLRLLDQPALSDPATVSALLSTPEPCTLGYTSEEKLHTALKIRLAKA